MYFDKLEHWKQTNKRWRFAKLDTSFQPTTLGKIHFSNGHIFFRSTNFAEDLKTYNISKLQHKQTLFFIKENEL